MSRRPGAEPTNWGSFFSGPAWELDEATGEYYLHLFSRKQPDLNWENPEVRAAVYAMMRWWLDRGVDGFRMDVINIISKDPALPDGPRAAGAAVRRRRRRTYICGPRIHEFLQEMHREVFAGRERAAHRRRDAGRHGRGGARCSPTRRAREVDMVFQFEHVQLDQRRDASGTSDAAATCATSRRRSGAGRPGWPSVGWNSLYWNNHDQPRVVSRFGDDGEHRVRSAKMLGTVLHLHRGTPYVYQGEELGMTNAPFARDRGLPRHRVAQPLRRGASPAGEDAARTCSPRCAPMSRDNARTPMQWDASAHAGFTTGTPWIAVNPNHAEINAAAAARRPRLGLPPLPAADRAAPRRAGVAARRLHDAAAGRRARLRLHAPPRRHRAAGARQLLRRARERGRRCRTPRRWAGAELLITNVQERGQTPLLRLEPWEARAYRRRA